MAVRIHYRGYFWSGSSHREGNALQVPDDFYSLAPTLDERCVRVHFVCECVYFCLCMCLIVCAVCSHSPYLWVYVSACVCVCGGGGLIYIFSRLVNMIPGDDHLYILPGDGWVSCD